MKGLNDAAMLAELLGSVVSEKCEYLWTASYSEEESREICRELLSPEMLFPN